MAVGLYTLDVGHGLCQIILFPNRRAIVIDGGDFRTHKIVSNFLEKHVDIILAYIATHNDKDHVGAFFPILDKYKTSDCLKRIYALIDRGSNSELPFVKYAKEREYNNTIGIFCCGYYINDTNPPKPGFIFEELSEKARVEFLYPRMIDTYDSLRAKKTNSKLQNRASGCIRLTVGANTALITGDIDLIGLTCIVDKYKFKLNANILTVPHHGGHIPGDKNSKSWNEIVHMILPSYAIVSTGSDFVVQEETFAPFAKHSIPVCCTQITKKCHKNFQQFHPSVTVQKRISIPQMSGDSRFPSAVACFGSIVTVFEKDSFRILGFEAHQQGINDKVQPSGTPLCRLQ